MLQVVVLVMDIYKYAVSYVPATTYRRHYPVKVLVVLVLRGRYGSLTAISSRVRLNS